MPDSYRKVLEQALANQRVEVAPDWFVGDRFSYDGEEYVVISDKELLESKNTPPHTPEVLAEWRKREEHYAGENLGIIGAKLLDNEVAVTYFYVPDEEIVREGDTNPFLEEGEGEPRW